MDTVPSPVAKLNLTCIRSSFVSRGRGDTNIVLVLVVLVG